MIATVLVVYDKGGIELTRRLLERATGSNARGAVDHADSSHGSRYGAGRGWRAAEPAATLERRLIDIEAEYSLRGLAPPFGLVTTEIDTLANATVRRVLQIRETP